MPDTSIEEAQRCPKCGQPGVQKSKHQAKGAKNQPVQVLVMCCMNEMCTWFEEGDGGGGWIIQLNPDGTIPDRSKMPSGPKQYTELTADQLASGQRQVEQIVQADLRGGE